MIFLVAGEPAVPISEALKALGFIGMAAFIGPLVIAGLFFFMNPQRFQPEKFKK